MLMEIILGFLFRMSPRRLNGKNKFMKIDELRNIIKKHGNLIRRVDIIYCIGVYKLLEHIEDVPGVVSLLRGFYRRTAGKYRKYRSLSDDHPDIMEFILNNTVVFGADDVWTNAVDNHYTYFYQGPGHDLTAITSLNRGG
jgi:hypothetical protein